MTHLGSVAPAINHSNVSQIWRCADGKDRRFEKAAVGSSRIIYYIILGTHIPLAGIILPFILFSAYRAMTGEFDKHKKLVRITWPVWFYVAITGVVVYWMISPYYN